MCLQARQQSPPPPPYSRLFFSSFSSSSPSAAAVAAAPTVVEVVHTTAVAAELCVASTFHVPHSISGSGRPPLLGRKAAFLPAPLFTPARRWFTPWPGQLGISLPIKTSSLDPNADLNPSIALLSPSEQVNHCPRPPAPR